MSIWDASKQESSPFDLKAFEAQKREIESLKEKVKDKAAKNILLNERLHKSQLRTQALDAENDKMKRIFKSNIQYQDEDDGMVVFDITLNDVQYKTMTGEELEK